MKETSQQTLEWAQLIAKNVELELKLHAEFAEKEKAKAEKWAALGRKPLGRPATWEFFWKKNQFKRGEGRGEIDTMRYCEEVLKPLLLPFMEELSNQIHDPDDTELDHYLFQQDNASLYASRWTKIVLEEAGIEILEHVGNSPDMNAIEQAWKPMCIDITKIWNRPHTLEWTARAWVARAAARENPNMGYAYGSDKSISH
jgi:hypothetical protein